MLSGAGAAVSSEPCSYESGLWTQMEESTKVADAGTHMNSSPRAQTASQLLACWLRSLCCKTDSQAPSASKLSNNTLKNSCS